MIDASSNTTFNILMPNGTIKKLSLPGTNYIITIGALLPGSKGSSGGYTSCLRVYEGKNAKGKQVLAICGVQGFWTEDLHVEDVAQPGKRDAKNDPLPF